MPKVKQRNHNEWFRPVERGGRKSCSHCKCKLAKGEWIFSWGNYINAKFHNIRDVCKECWHEVRDRLTGHAGDCGCSITIRCTGTTQPEWMTLEKACELSSSSQTAP